MHPQATVEAAAGVEGDAAFAALAFLESLTALARSQLDEGATCSAPTIDVHVDTGVVVEGSMVPFACIHSFRFVAQRTGCMRSCLLFQGATAS